MIISGVSTILFNGNPLLRYDAYYMLSDFLEIPNLALRANRYIGYICRRYLLNIKEARTPVTDRGEAQWMFFYGFASFFYRIFITIRIALFVAGKFFIIGIILMIWGLFNAVASPVYRVARLLVMDSQLRLKRKRVILLAGGLLLLLLIAILAVPFPSFTVAEGVLWPPDNSQVVAGVDGFIKEVKVSSGREVRRGDVLLVCENWDLEAELAVLEAQYKELEARYRLSSVKDRTDAEIVKDEMSSLEEEITRKKAQKAELVIKSPCDGIFLLDRGDDIAGQLLRRGARIGYVVDFSGVTGRVVVTQGDIDRVRSENKSVTVRTAGETGREYSALVKREIPAASNDLPSLALSLEGGGSIALDPNEKDGAKSYEKLFQFEIAISEAPINTIGERIYARFEHSPEPLALRWYRAVRRTLLGKFNV
jgi:putative peptide zinc metalloprotease protein